MNLDILETSFITHDNHIFNFATWIYLLNWDRKSRILSDKSQIVIKPRFMEWEVVLYGIRMDIMKFLLYGNRPKGMEWEVFLGSPNRTRSKYPRPPPKRTGSLIVPNKSHKTPCIEIVSSAKMDWQQSWASVWDSTPRLELMEVGLGLRNRLGL